MPLPHPFSRLPSYPKQKPLTGIWCRVPMRPRWFFLFFPLRSVFLTCCCGLDTSSDNSPRLVISGPLLDDREKNLGDVPILKSASSKKNKKSNIDLPVNEDFNIMYVLFSSPWNQTCHSALPSFRPDDRQAVLRLSLAS